MQHLADSAVFGGLDPSVLQGLAEDSWTSNHKKGTTLYKWGQKADELVVVLEGRLDISRPGANEKPMHLRSLQPGDIVGLSLIAGEVHSADLIAGTKLVVARIPGATIRRLFRNQPEVALRVIASLGALVGDLTDEISDLRFKSLVERLLKAIADLSKGSERLYLTQEELAALVGATRENVARALARLEGEGKIARGRGWVQLLPT
jgi:CRP-like cAMP-binding protein